MKCPFCSSADTQVIDSRVSDAGDSIRRRRRCMACQKRFTTYENVELRLPQVVKSDGSRADFDERRIRVGFQRALHKRPVPTEYVDASIKRIVQQVLSLVPLQLGRPTDRAYRHQCPPRPRVCRLKASESPARAAAESQPGW